MGKVIFIRHGESMGNVNSYQYNNPDMNFLSLHGAMQAQMAAATVKRLTQHRHDKIVVWTSDLVRARHTAAVLMQSLDDWETRTYFNTPLLNEWCWNANNQKQWFLTEPEKDMKSRINDFMANRLLKTMEDNTDITQIVVSHAYTMECIFQAIEGVDKRLNPAAIVSIPNAVPYIWDGSGIPQLVTPWKYDVAR